MQERHLNSEGFRKIIDEITRIQNELDNYKRVKDYWDSFYGEGLEIANWHLNGSTEPFETFWESAEDIFRNNNKEFAKQN